MSRRPSRCTQADIRRALEAAKASGECLAVEILPDGTIRLRPTEKLVGNSKAFDEEEVIRLC